MLSLIADSSPDNTIVLVVIDGTAAGSERDVGN